MIEVLLRYRLWVIGAVALLNAALDAAGSGADSDFFVLTDVARDLLSARWLNALDEAWVQVGPLGLLWPAANAVIHEATGLSAALTFSVTVYLGVTFGVVLLIRVLARGSGVEPAPWVELWAGLAVIMAGVCWTAVSSGQPFDVLVGILWLLVARAARNDRPVLSGALLGVACAIKLSAVLGVPLLLLLPGFRRRLGATAIASAVAIGAYAPFLIWGDGGTFGFAWRVSQNSLISYLVTPGTAFDWDMRVIQSAVVVALGAAGVVALRGSRHVVWAAPFVISVLRVVTDPLSFSYYWLGAEVVAAVGIALLLRDAAPVARALLAAGYLALGLAPIVPGAATPIRLALAVGLVAYLGAGQGAATTVEEAPAPV